MLSHLYTGKKCIGNLVHTSILPTYSDGSKHSLKSNLSKTCESVFSTEGNGFTIFIVMTSLHKVINFLQYVEKLVPNTKNYNLATMEL